MESLRKTELLAPAGNLQKLKCALHFGADAVYVGGKELSLRAMSGNFDDDQLREGVLYAHALNKKVYVAVNVFAKNADFEKAEAYFCFLRQIGADAVIISDPGLFALCKSVAPSLDIHLSTQANTTNKFSARFWSEQGARRIVLARELSLAETAEIHEFLPELELEAFVHGAMCVSYSGRCMLSSYFSGRSANRGECVQPCRWSYKLLREERSDERALCIEEDNRGAYFLNSRDLNLLTKLPELTAAGVTSFKIEGRMKSEFYIASVTLAYRRALDEIKKTGGIQSGEALNGLLESVAHRPYTQAFSDGDNLDTLSPECERAEDKYKFIAQAESGENGFVTVEMRNRFLKGDTLEILSPDESICFKSFVAERIFDEKAQPVTDAKLVQHRYKIACPHRLSKGDILRRRLD
jgi:putative protease